MIINHLLYIVMNPNSTTVNHWKNEIYAAIPRVDVLKGNNKYPKAKQIYKWTYGKDRDRIVGPNSTIKRKVEQAISKEHFIGNYDPDALCELLDNACVEYFTWLANDLSVYGETTNDLVSEEIDRIIREIL